MDNLKLYTTATPPYRFTYFFFHLHRGLPLCRFIRLACIQKCKQCGELIRVIPLCLFRTVRTPDFLRFRGSMHLNCHHMHRYTREADPSPTFCTFLCISSKWDAHRRALFVVRKWNVVMHMHLCSLQHFWWRRCILFFTWMHLRDAPAVVPSGDAIDRKLYISPHHFISSFLSSLHQRCIRALHLIESLKCTWSHPGMHRRCKERCKERCTGT